MICLSLAQGITAPVYASGDAYRLLKEKANKIDSENTKNGWAYIISGSVALAVSIPAYYMSEDIFAKAIYSLGQTLGVVAVGYGSYLVLVADDYSRFVGVIDKARMLDQHEKNELAEVFLRENASRARNIRKIRVICHSLTAGLNFMSAATTGHRELQTALLFIGGINALAALNFALSRSEEEKMIEERKPAGKVSMVVGPVVGISISF